jgi:hypothetical protein
MDILPLAEEVLGDFRKEGSNFNAKRQRGDLASKQKGKTLKRRGKPSTAPFFLYPVTKTPLELVGLGCACVHGRSAVETASESGARGVEENSSRAAWRANRRAKASSEADALGSSRAARSRSAALECFGPIVLSTPPNCGNRELCTILRKQPTTS